MSSFKTDQEKFWAGEFGKDYTIRNDEKIIHSNKVMFNKIFNVTGKVNRFIEFGANRGNNLKAVTELMPDIEMSAIEINEYAVELLNQLGLANVYHQSILDYETDFQRDFVLIKGVLIHINPECLSDVYRKLYETSNKYICIAEYYNPTPTEIKYRGHEGYLFKRDFAGEMLDMYKDLRLVDYGFFYHRDNESPMDDITWFLLEKQ